MKSSLHGRPLKPEVVRRLHGYGETDYGDIDVNGKSYRGYASGFFRGESSLTEERMAAYLNNHLP